MDRMVTFLYPFPLDAVAETLAMPFLFPFPFPSGKVTNSPVEVVKYLYLPLPFPLTFPLTLVHEMYLMNVGALDGSADFDGSALGDIEIEGSEDVVGSTDGTLDFDGTAEIVGKNDGAANAVGACVGGIVGNALGVPSSSNAIFGTRSTEAALVRVCLLEP